MEKGTRVRFGKYDKVTKEAQERTSNHLLFKSGNIVHKILRPSCQFAPSTGRSARGAEQLGRPRRQLHSAGACQLWRPFGRARCRGSAERIGHHIGEAWGVGAHCRHKRSLGQQQGHFASDDGGACSVRLHLQQEREGGDGVRSDLESGPLLLPLRPPNEHGHPHSQALPSLLASGVPDLMRKSRLVLRGQGI